MERLTQEFNKALLRRKQRLKVYKIPQSFHVFGKTPAYRTRLLVGALLTLIGVTLLVVMWVTKLDIRWRLVVGVILSAVPSLGGAWKDGPIEGFDTKKFPRSFVIMSGCVWLLSGLTDNLAVLVLAAGGMERVMVEFYKTFMLRSIPGKFIGKVISEDWLIRRQIFILTYILAVGAIASILR